MFDRIKKIFKGKQNQKEAKVSDTVERRVMPKLLAKILMEFPLPEPSRIVEGGAGDWLAEWHIDGKYFEIECCAGKLEIMSHVGSSIAHWVLKKV